MPANTVTINFKDGDSTTRTGQFLSGNGSANGTLSPVHGVLAANGDLITPALDSTASAMSAKLPAALGRTSAANSVSITFSTEDRATQNSILTSLETAVTSLPHFALDANTDLTYSFNSNSSSGEVTLVAAQAANTTKVYRTIVTAANATVIEFRDGAAGASLLTLEFPTAGAYTLDFEPRPWLKTTANTALVRNSTNAVKVTISTWYVRS